jgi:hypothetical protein
MNIPEELENPQRDVPKIYWAMLLILLVVGGSLALLVFLLLPPEVLLAHSGDLLGQLGRHVGSASPARWSSPTRGAPIMLANAALMLIAATNTAFVGARGLWLAMARDDLLPRMLLVANERGAFSRLHWLMLLACGLLAVQADWHLVTLERWYWAMFGLVLLSGMVGFVLLRRFKADDRRVYVAPWNITLFRGCACRSRPHRRPGPQLRAADDVDQLACADGRAAHCCSPRSWCWSAPWCWSTTTAADPRRLPLLSPRPRDGRVDRHRPTAAHHRRRGRRRAGRPADRQGHRPGPPAEPRHRHPYRQVVVFHMTKGVRSEFVYRVTRDSIRPEGIEGNVIRIFTELTEIAPTDMDLYLALVPNKHTQKSPMVAARRPRRLPRAPQLQGAHDHGRHLRREAGRHRGAAGPPQGHDPRPGPAVRRLLTPLGDAPTR